MTAVYISWMEQGFLRLTKEMILKPALAKGYYFVALSKNDKQKLFLVHRLVALHFIPNPQNKPEVNHEDLNKLNNYFQNLGWATRVENEVHYFKNRKVA